MSTSLDDNARVQRLSSELLGAMAYGELSAFGRLSFDSRYAPTLHDRAVLAKIAVGAYGNFAMISSRLSEMVDAWLLGTGLGELAEYETRMSSLTAEELQGVAVRYFEAERRVEGIVRGRPGKTA